MTPGRPAAVARYERRPLWWFAAAVVLAALVFVDEARTSHAVEPGDDALLVEGVVTANHSGALLPVRYEHPTTQQTIELDVVVRRPSLRPPPGSTVQLVVSPSDPGDVKVRGDRAPATDLAWEYLPIVGLPLAVYVRRRWHRSRVERLIAQHTASFAMLGALGPPRAGGRRPLLSLYALDATAGSAAMCSIPILATNGAPFGSVLPVEVKGSPRAHGRVVAYYREVLWPTGRAAGRAGVPLPTRNAELDDEPGAVPITIQRPRWENWARVWQIEWILVGVSVALIAMVATITAVHARDARELQRSGTPVVVTVTGRGDSALDVVYASGDEEITTTTPADFPEDYTIGRRYPARADPGNPSRLRLLAEPYDVREPIAWATVPLVALLLWIASRAWQFRRARRAAPGAPTRQFDGRVVRVGNRVADLDIGRFAEPGARCTVRIPRGELPDRFHGALLVRGSPAPGEALAVAAGGRSLTVIGPARSPRPLER